MENDDNDDDIILMENSLNLFSFIFCCHLIIFLFGSNKEEGKNLGNPEKRIR